ncbi:MAG: hypothetical protein U0941_06435 [Planctomycetaceae bacterium]
MHSLRSRFVFSLIACTLGWIIPAVVQAAPADAIPSTACVVIRLKSPDATLEKLADYVDEVQTGVGAIVRGAKNQLGEAFGNPGLKGVDPTQDIFIVVFAEPQVPPTVVFVMTAKDVDDVKDALQSQFEIHSSGKVIAYSTDEDALAEVRKRMDGEGKPVWSRIDPASKKLFDSSDASILVNIKQLAEDFSDELEQAEPQLNAFIDRIQEIIPEEQKSQVTAAFEMYRVLGAGVLAGVRDSNSLVMGLSVSSTEIRYDDRLQVNEGTATAKALAGQPAGDLNLVNRLPVGKAIYAGMNLDLSGMIEMSFNISRDMMSRDMTEEQSKRMENAIKKVISEKSKEISMYIDVAGETQVLRIGGVNVVQSPQVLRDASRELMKVMGDTKIQTPQFTQTSKLEIDAEKIGSATVDRVTTRFEYSDAADPTGIQQKIVKAMMGEAGMTQRILYQPNRIVQITGGDKAEFEELVKSLDTAPAKNSPAIVARKQFDEKTNLLALVDVSRLTLGILKAIAANNKDAPINVEELSGLKLEPSFLGYSLTLEPNGAKSRLVVPVTLIKNINQIFNAAANR